MAVARIYRVAQIVPGLLTVLNRFISLFLPPNAMIRMNAREARFGYVIPRPWLSDSHLGDIAHIDKDGVLRTKGSIFDDTDFKTLVAQSPYTMDRTPIVEEHPSMMVAFTTGCVDVKPLSDEECSRRLVLRTMANG